MRASRVVVLPYSARQMFALADEIERYPEFLPWCEGAEVARGEGAETVRATLRINHFGLRTAFTTVNLHQKPERITMTLAEDGAGRSLSFLRGEWCFADLPDGRCRAAFDLEYRFRNRLMAAIFSGMFAAFFGKFAGCFIARARQLYGESVNTPPISDGGGWGGEKPKSPITIEVVGAGESGYWSKKITLPPQSTLAEALAAAGAKKTQAAGIWGRQRPPETVLAAGDRVEIYQPLAADPRLARRARAKQER